MRHGLNTAFEEFLRMGVALIERARLWQNVTAASAASFRALTQSAEYATVNTLFWSYLTPSLLEAVQRRQAVVFAQLRDYFALVRVLAGVLVASMVALPLFLYDPLVRQLDRRLKQTRALLLLIPLSVFEQVRQLRKLAMSVSE
jgi:hypothetical protein